MHEMTIAIDDPAVSQSVCRAASRGFAVQKRLTGSISCLDEDSQGCKAQCIRRGSRSSTARGRGFDAAFAKLLWPLAIGSWPSFIAIPPCCPSVDPYSLITRSGL